MPRTSLNILMILTLLAVPSTAPLAAQAPPSEAGLERQVRQLNETLGQLVELLRRQLEGSNATVLMQRVQLMTNRMAPLEEELRTARAVELDLQNQLGDLETSANSYRTHLETEVEMGEITEEEARIRSDQQERLLSESRKQTENRLWTAQQRVIDLEQALTARRAELETWEGEIDRVLGLR